MGWSHDLLTSQLCSVLSQDIRADGAILDQAGELNSSSHRGGGDSTGSQVNSAFYLWSTNSSDLMTLGIRTRTSLLPWSVGVWRAKKVTGRESSRGRRSRRRGTQQGHTLDYNLRWYTLHHSHLWAWRHQPSTTSDSNYRRRLTETPFRTIQQIVSPYACVYSLVI